MFRNFIVVGFRNLTRNKLFTFINLVSLAISMSVGLIIIAMIHDLLEYDTFHMDKDRIYRITSDVRYSLYGHHENATAALPIANRLQNFQGVEKVIRVQSRLKGIVDTGDKQLPIQGYFVDSTFLDVFTFPLIAGDGSLSKPFTIVLTESASKKLFGNQDPLDRVVEIDDFGSFTITGIIADVPKFSHFQFEMLGSFNTVPILERDKLLFPTIDKWESLQTSYVYLLLDSPDEIAPIKKELSRIGNNVYGEREDVKATFSLQSLNNIIPGPDLSDQIGPKMMFLPIVILSSLALIILLSACFNYTNLSIARSLKRAKEFGMRRVSGSSRLQVGLQLISETIIISLAALMISVFVFILIRPGFLQIVPRAGEVLDLNLSLELVITFTVYAVFAGILAGILPALYFSRVNPLQALRNPGSLKILKKMNLRKTLITVQFTLSLLFLTGVIIIARQYRFSLNYDLGFTKENILNISLQGNDHNIVKAEMQKHAEISQLSMSSLVPGINSSSSTWIKSIDSQDSLIANYISVDPGFIPTMGLQLITGRNFEPQEIRTAIIVNEAFLKAFHAEFSEDVVGQVFSEFGSDLQVIGVVRDFHYQHLEEKIDPFFLIYDPEIFSYANVKLYSSDLPATMGKLASTWQSFDPGNKFKASFMEEDIRDAYQFLTNFMKLFGFVGLVAIVIAILGLIGMAVYSTETRMKEIGIRKILGATNFRLIALLSKGFLKLLAIAACIALPATFFLFDRVILALHYYRPQISPSDLIVSFLLMLGLGLLSIGSQTYSAANTNPAETLRNE